MWQRLWAPGDEERWNQGSAGFHGSSHERSRNKPKYARDGPVMNRERTTDQILRVQLAPGAKGRATGGSRGARRTPGPSKDHAKRAGYTRGTNTRARDILLFADGGWKCEERLTGAGKYRTIVYNVICMCGCSFIARFHSAGFTTAGDPTSPFHHICCVLVYNHEI